MRTLIAIACLVTNTLIVLGDLYHWGSNLSPNTTGHPATNGLTPYIWANPDDLTGAIGDKSTSWGHVGAFTNTAAASPTITIAENGFRGLAFDTTNSALSNLAFSAPMVTNGLAIFVVFQQTGKITAARFVWKFNGSFDLQFDIGSTLATLPYEQRFMIRHDSTDASEGALSQLKWPVGLGASTTYVLGFRSYGTNTATGLFPLYQLASINGSTTPIAHDISHYNITGPLKLGDGTMTGAIYQEVIAYTNILTSAQFYDITDYLTRKYASPPPSMLRGDYESPMGGRAFGNDEKNFAPFNFRLTEALPNAIHYHNDGTLHTISSFFASPSFESSPSLDRPLNLYLCWAGSDEIFLGSNAVDMAVLYLDVLRRAREVGYKSVAMTAMPREPAPGDDAFLQRWLDFNQYIRTNWVGSANFFIDLTLVTGFTSTNGYTNTVYYNTGGAPNYRSGPTAYGSALLTDYVIKRIKQECPPAEMLTPAVFKRRDSGLKW